MPQKFKPGELTDSILEVIADYLIDMGGYYKPRLNVILGEIIKTFLKNKKQKINESKIKRTLNNLEKRNLINIEEKGDKVIVSFTEKGKPIILKYSIRSLLEFKKKNKKWNGKWFMVFFDVPEIQRNKRDYLRRFLKQMGFFPYQKSVYIFPYECEKEISLIKQIIEGGKYMKYIIAEKIEDENKAKIFFNLH